MAIFKTLDKNGRELWWDDSDGKKKRIPKPSGASKPAPKSKKTVVSIEPKKTSTVFGINTPSTIFGMETKKIRVLPSVNAFWSFEIYDLTNKDVELLYSVGLYTDSTEKAKELLSGLITDNQIFKHLKKDVLSIISQMVSKKKFYRNGMLGVRLSIYQVEKNRIFIPTKTPKYEDFGTEHSNLDIRPRISIKLIKRVKNSEGGLSSFPVKNYLILRKDLTPAALLYELEENNFKWADFLDRNEWKRILANAVPNHEFVTEIPDYNIDLRFTPIEKEFKFYLN